MTWREGRRSETCEACETQYGRCEDEASNLRECADCGAEVCDGCRVLCGCACGATVCTDCGVRFDGALWLRDCLDIRHARDLAEAWEAFEDLRRVEEALGVAASARPQFAARHAHRQGRRAAA